EVKEETGLDFQPTSLFLEREQEDDIFGKWRVYYFIGETSGELKLNEDEITDVIYVSEEEADSRRNIAFDHNKILKDFFKNQ
ncbi:MAG: NUDIX domain-containing protein, partial [Nanoarchaeota archaeon]